MWSPDFAALPDAATIALVLLGALIAGFTTGFAGFGTGLVASGLWFHALPAHMVPPLVVLASVAAQIVGLVAVRASFRWQAAAPLLIGGVLGVPLGVAALAAASPGAIRTSIAAFLIFYALFQLLQQRPPSLGRGVGRWADIAVGAAGGFLGGFAGLSGPLPLIWLQLRGGGSDAQRATYQPFNLVVLALAGVTMALGGQMGSAVVTVALLCLPVTLFGAALGARTYARISQQAFRRLMLALLLLSGVTLLAQAALAL